MAAAWAASGKALGMRGVCVGEDASSRSDALIGEAVVDVVRGQEADAAVSMLAVVPVEKGAAMGSTVLRAPNPARLGES